MSEGLQRLRRARPRLGVPPVGYQHGRHARIVRQFPLIHWAYYWLTAHTTPRLFLTGIVGVAPTAFLMLAGLDNRTTMMGFAVLAWIAACLAAGLLLCPSLRVEATLPVRVACGGAFDVRYHVRNMGRRAARGVQLETLIYSGVTHLRLRRLALGTLAAGDEAVVAGGGIARVRGVFTLPALRWDADFPCGFWRWGRTQPGERVLFVYPRHERLESLDLPLGPRRHQDLSAARERSREAFEFHGCREFRDGDALRHVHARSSARLGVPVVKEFQAEGRARTALLVDTRCRSRLTRLREDIWKDARVEAALSLAASIVEALARTDRVLELMVAGPEVYRFVSAGRTGYLEDVLDILASIEPCRDDPFERLGPLLLDEIRAIQSVCLVLTGWDAQRAALVAELEACEVGMKIVVVTRDGERPAGAPAAAICLASRAILRGEVCRV